MVTNLASSDRAPPNVLPGAGSNQRGRGRGRGRARGRGANGPVSSPSGRGSAAARGNLSTAKNSQKPSRNSRSSRTPRQRGEFVGGVGAPSSRPTRPAVKLCIRSLPPSISAVEFFERADPEKKATWTSLRPGTTRPPDSPKPPRLTVAYAAFATLTDADVFFERVHGTVFQETNGSMQYTAHVERALNQAVPKPERKSFQALAGTIESDPDFLQFLSIFNEERSAELALNANASLSDTDALFRDHSPTDAASSAVKTTPSSAAGDAVPVTLLEGGRNSDTDAAVVTPLIEDVRARRRERDVVKAALKKSGRRTRKFPVTGGVTSCYSNSIATVTPTPLKSPTLKPLAAATQSPVAKPSVQSAGKVREGRTPKAKITVLHSVTSPTRERLAAKSSSSHSPAPSSRKSESGLQTQSKPFSGTSKVSAPINVADPTLNAPSQAANTNVVPPQQTVRKGKARLTGSTNVGGRRGGKFSSKPERGESSKAGVVRGSSNPKSYHGQANPLSNDVSEVRSVSTPQGEACMTKPPTKVRLLRKQTSPHPGT